SVGVPTVGGEVVFDPCYTGNPLVNVLCLGVLPRDRLVLARAEGEGNLAVLVGASTGRDGIGGASVLASAGFEEGGEEKRPSVQVGDPFEEKKLIEACLDLLEAGLATGVQDLGAAGLCCAASETAARGGAGMDLDLDQVRQREPGMTAAEVLTSESQERMLVIARPGNLEELLDRCAHLEVDASVVGRVTRTGRLKVFSKRSAGDAEVLVADVPAASLGDGPVYDRPAYPPPGREQTTAADPWPLLLRRLPESGDLGGELLALLASPNVAEKSWVWRQYDHQLFLNTIAGPGGDAAVLRLRGTSAALAISTDGNSRFCYLDPRTGGRLAVLEAARNVACAGATPKALVNCLNFGNPEHPEVMWQFREVVEGLAEACEALDLPVVGGNVSFYNESDGIDINPTPVVGVVGLIDPFDGSVLPPRIAPGQRVLLLGDTREELGGSEWAFRHGLEGGLPPLADLEVATRAHELMRSLVAGGIVAGIHDCADGGLAVTVAEMAVAGGCGMSLRLDDASALHPAAALFAESASRAVVAVEPSSVGEVLDRAAALGVAAVHLGVAGGERLTVEGAVDLPLEQVASAWRGGIPALVGEQDG
ncbi:MAG: phosphoribosylformylglycinamidine synthase subunit PurL, partial [Acidimicrobiia bacterium]